MTSRCLDLPSSPHEGEVRDKIAVSGQARSRKAGVVVTSFAGASVDFSCVVKLPRSRYLMNMTITQCKLCNGGVEMVDAGVS